MCGKAIRLAKIIHPRTHKTCIVPLDHGVTLGCIHGLTDYESTIKAVSRGGADAIILHKGLLNRISRTEELCRNEYIMHLSVSTSLGVSQKRKIVAGSVEEAVRMGASGISVHINLGGEYEPEMISDLGTVSSACMEYGMPLLAMMYSEREDNSCKVLLHMARIAEELGADIIKIQCPEKSEDIETLADSICTPVVIAGGPNKGDYIQIMRQVDTAVKAGLSGIAIGRNIFQSSNPLQVTSLLCKLVHGDLNINECIDILKEYKI